MALHTDQLRDILGRNGNVIGTDGKIGGIGQVYLDNDSGEPEWVTAKTGLFGSSESFVPLAGARVEGDDIHVAYDKGTVKDAPRVDSDGSLSPQDEELLYRHYGMADSYDTFSSRETETTGTVGTETVGTTTRDRDTVGHDTVGHDTSGPTTDDAMTRSEERLRVGTRSEESGRVKLRKFVVTEQVTETVPVRREEARVVREPITDANVGAATSGPTISEEEHEVILHEERPVVQKEAVPVERVRLDTETVTEQVTVNEQIRKEQIDVDVDEQTRRP